ncbi:heat shock protein 30 [Ophiostoma piceae UAMH 11346]|uniref:Heat shock protein 30 n=1 Tax=Ophiostoma piceae (strain UAMH 11346) TaxID=1262450 RepID=S3CA58_OPHP1|nr:heat shock protein 30 [Ophiostoma piceae UAMH 11346]
MAVIQFRRNDALDINPPAGDQYLSVNGSDWLWTVTAIHICSFLVVFCLSFVARAGERVFHHIFSIALLVGSVSYFAMASDLGWSLVATANELSNGLTRQIFFVKYINWVVTFPSAIIALGLLSGIAWATIVYQVFLSWYWVLSYLASAYTTTSYKWGFYAFGTVAWLLLAFSQLVSDGRKSALRVGVSRDYTVLAGWLNLLWLLYPIAYGVSDGGNKIGETAGLIFFSVLDVLLIPVLACATLVLARRWDYNKLNIVFTQYGRVSVAGQSFPEKKAPVAAAVDGPAAGVVSA